MKISIYLVKRLKSSDALLIQFLFYSLFNDTVSCIYAPFWWHKYVFTIWRQRINSNGRPRYKWMALKTVYTAQVYQLLNLLIDHNLRAYHSDKDNLCMPMSRLKQSRESSLITSEEYKHKRVSQVVTKEWRLKTINKSWKPL